MLDGLRQGLVRLTLRAEELMPDNGVGRVLVASLHQGIADILPTRLGFYENWLNVQGLRGGTIGLAPSMRSSAFFGRKGTCMS